jgi:hypothetical protein
VTSRDSKLPSFDQFSRWLAARLDQPALRPERYETLREAARAARDEFVQTRPAAAQGLLEVLYLLAAADKSESSQLPEMTTPRGFRVLLAHDEGGGSRAATIGVLVYCPTELISALEGQTACLWYGTERFELGQFDGEGKAIGELPAGVDITASDFAQGKVKLEEPRSIDE